MNVRWKVALVLGVATLALACTGYAEQTKQRDQATSNHADRSDPPNTASSEEAATRKAAVKRTIDRYLQADAKGDYDAMTPLFTHDARLKYTYRWGTGYKDTVYEVDLSKPMNPDAATYLDHFEGYETVARKSRIESLTLEPTGEAVAVVVVTERYRYQGHKGTATTKLHMTLTNTPPRISRLNSITK